MQPNEMKRKHLSRKINMNNCATKQFIIRKIADETGRVDIEVVIFVFQFMYKDTHIH